MHLVPVVEGKGTIKIPVRFGKWKNAEMNAAPMVTLNSNYMSMRAACNPTYSRGLFGASGVLPPPRASQSINLYASLVLMVRSRRGEKVVENCEAVGGGFVHARPSPKSLEPQDVVHRRLREGHEDIQCSQ